MDLPDVNKHKTCGSRSQALRQLRIGNGIVLRSLDQGGDQEEADALNGKGGDERLDAPHAVNDEGRSGGAGDAKGVCQAGEPEGLVGVEAGELKEDAGPADDGEDASPLLDPLQGEAEDGAAAEVQLAGEAAAEDDVGEVVALVVVCLDDGVEELDFGGDDGVVGG